MANRILPQTSKTVAAVRNLAERDTVWHQDPSRQWLERGARPPTTGLSFSSDRDILGMEKILLQRVSYAASAGQRNVAGVPLRLMLLTTHEMRGLGYNELPATEVALHERDDAVPVSLPRRLLGF